MAAVVVDRVQALLGVAVLILPEVAAASAATALEEAALARDSPREQL
jgi:hypothetical protein